MLNLPSSISKRIALLLLTPFFVLAGLNHFKNPNFYMSIMPPYLPAHSELVAMSGLLEILGGVAVLFSTTRKWAGYGLIVLMVLVYPANIYMALQPERFAHMAPRWILYLRLPIQFVIIAWIYWVTTPDRAKSKTS